MALIRMDKSILTPQAVASAYYLPSYEGGEDENRGGPLGGVGYLGEKAGLGFISSVEGIWDFSSSLVAKLFGADEWAERQFVNDWVNYNHADEWFNPSEGWKFAGDVAGGIGTSLPAIAGVATGAAIAVASGGTLTPLAAGIISGSIVGLGAAGNATKEAYRESGKLSIKEFGYGALSGATEAGIELLTAGIGTGTGRIISGIAKKTSKEVTETLAKNGAKTALKNLGIDFISEGFEEGFAEAINPVYKRMTYDPSAKNASIHEITYSAIVGGISGLVMGGGNTAINTTTNIASGKKALKDGSVNSILEKSKQIAEAEGKNDTGYESFKNIKSAYEQLSQSLEKTNGEISTIRQKALLGQLKQETVRAQLMPYIERSAEKIVQNAELVAQKYSEYGLKDANGKPISVTAKDILSGIDVTADRKTYIKQLRKALTTNSVLSTLAVVDATGNITMDTAKFAEATLKAKNLADHADLEYFVTHATEAEKATVGKALGIQDWNTVSVDQFRNKVAAFAESGKLYEYATKTKQSEQNTVKTLDNDSGIRYALNKAKYISYSKIGKSQVENVRSKLKQLYSDIDSGVATEIAIEDGNTVYIVDSGKENGKINFGFRKKLVISDESLRKDFIRRRNNDSVSKGHISDGLSSKFRDEYDNGRRGDRRLETGEKLSADKGQSQNNEGRISSDNGNRGRLTSDKKALPGDENSRSDIGEATEAKSMTVIESATFAKENVPEYAELNADDQARIRRLIRQAKANGFTDAQTRAYARVSARSGIDIVFDKERLYRGNGKYADGLYSHKQNKIFINPEGSRSPARLLIHELTHALYNDRQSRVILDRGAKNLTEDQKKEIWNKYFPDAEYNENNIIFKDELSSHYTEALLDDDALLEKLCNDNPTLKDKILSFFKKAITGYSDEPNLSREAKKLYKRYKTLFDSFSERNQYNAVSSINNKNMHDTEGRERYATSDNDYSDYDKPITLKDVEVLRSIGRKSINEFTSDDIKKSQKWAYKFYKELGVKSPFFRTWFGDWRAHQTKKKVNVAKIPEYTATNEARKQNRGTVTNNDTKWDIRISREGETNTISHAGEQRLSEYGLSGIRELIENAVLFDSEIHEHHSNNAKEDRITLDHKLYALGKSIDGTIALYRITVEETYQSYKQPHDKRFHNLKYIEKVADNIGSLTHGQSRGAESTNDVSTTTYSISDLYEFVKTFDKEFTPAPEISADAAKLLLNKDGTPKVFYHGTNNNFYKFSYGDIGSATGVGILGEGFYFTEKRDLAKKYGKNVMPCYLQMKKPYIAKSEEAYKLNSAALEKQGYDGVILKAPAGDIYMLFDNTQIKSATDNIGTFDKTNPDIRYALPDTESDSDGLNFAQDEAFDFEGIATQGMPRTTGKSSLTVGELRKVIANNTKQKVYSKQDALSVVGRFTGISGLTQKTRTQIADAVWQILNESPDVQYRRDVAHDMAEFIVAKMITDSKTENPDVIEARERLDYLRTGIGRISFSEGDMSDIRHVLDKKGLKQILGRWGYKNRQGAQRIPLDVFVCDIARQMPSMEYLDDMNPVDAFLEIDALYHRAKAEAKDKWISAYWDMPDSEIPNMIKSIEDEIMRAYETEGSQSKFSKMIENKISYYSERAEFWKAEYDKLSGRNRLLGLLMSKAQKMKDLKLGTFANSTQYDSEIFKSSIEKLARIQYRGNLNVGGTRKIISDLHKWYTSDDVKKGVLGYIDESNPGLYVQGVSDMLETLSNGDIGFTKDDLKMLYDVMSYFTNFVENWGKVYRRGRWIEAKPEAERFINTLHENEDLKVGLFSKLAGTTYMQTFGDPMTVARRMDRYESGFYTEMLSELRDAAVDAQVAEMEMRTAYDEFLKKNKNYVEQSTVEKVTYRGVQIPKQQIISLYMTMKRNHSWAGVALSGFAITDIDGKRVRVGGIVSPDTKLSEAEMKKLIEEQSSAIEALLTKTDKEYIAILEQAYNVDARNAKADRDKQRLGFTNVTNDYYYPIRRGNISKNIDTNIMSEIDRVSNSSFNKDTVRGAKQELYIEPADVVFNRHIHAVCQYAYLSPAIEAYNVLYNIDISGNPNKPISVATESANTWNKGNKYFAKLISDIQGIPASSDEGMKALGFIRGSYAKFQLGANPKVWLTQLSSVFASSSMLDADSIARGMSISSKDIDEYCSLAKLRNYDNTAAMAQAVLDSKTKRTISKIGKFSDLLMSPIGKMDRFTVGRLFGACQAQVEKNGGAKVGTDANKIEAGKLLRRVILETQQNSIATERSAAMRSGNEIMRTLTMFTSDSMKVIGRVIDSIGEASTLRARLRTNTDADSKAKLQQQLKEANRKMRKSVGALCLTAVFMASIAQLFRWLYDKEQDEDESVAETMLVDAVGNLFGGLPLFKDAYAKIFEGYDVDNYAYSAINDLLDSALNLFSVAENLLTNEGSAQERNLAIRKLSYSVGQILGIPTRNVYNVFYGLTKRFNPETAYVIDNAFYKKNYQNDLYKAIERDDTEMSSFIMSLLLGERMNENIDEGVFNELLTLSKKGQKVLPKTIPSSITVKGVEYALTDAEQAAIKSIYVKAEKSLKSLFSKAKYKALSDEQKTEVIDFVYDTYYDKALVDTLGIDRGNNSLLAEAVSVDLLALLNIATKGLTSDTDKKGNVISGSKKKKVIAAINALGVSREQRLLLIASKGYSLTDSEKKRLLSYILKLKTTKEKRIELAELCGFTVRNGKIVADFK